MGQSEGYPPRRGIPFTRVLIRFVLLVWAGLFVGVLGVGLLAFVVYDHVRGPGLAGPPVTVEVPKSASGRDIGALLKERGLIEHEGLFRLAMRLDGSEKPLQNGVYELPKGLSALEILRRMQKGPTRPSFEDQFKVTIPEGLTLQQTAALLDMGEEFLAAAADADLIARLGLSVKNLEGFLMPNTYYFDKKPTGRQLAERMLQQFEDDWERLTENLPGAERLDRLAVVTIASLVEEEARVDDERALVAAVLYNRLREGMPLQMDSTLQFALDKYGQRLLDKDKQVKSPYNTYLNRGLPPGPISSPGRASLRAALYPANEQYLYFVSNADGKTHTFSVTYEQHQAAVAKFRREIAEQRRNTGQ